MEGQPKFKVKKETPFGPVLERESDSVKDESFEEVEGTDIGYGPTLRKKGFNIEVDPTSEIISKKEKEGWLNEKQQKQLRAILLSLGIGVLGGKEIKQSDYVTDSMQPNNVTENSDANNFQNATIENSREDKDKFQREVEDFAKSINDLDLSYTQEYANKPVVGAEEYTREQYVREALKFEEWNEEDKTGVPPIVQNELRNVISGLCAQESKFDADSKSSKGATSIFQILPENWERYGGALGKEKNLVEQVKVAGNFISSLYEQLNKRISKENIDILRSHAGSEEEFYKDIMVPLIVNSYNVGAGGMVKAVEYYLENTPVEELPQGRDLYIAIADSAYESNEGYLESYKKHSREYVPKVYAFAERLKEDSKG